MDLHSYITDRNNGGLQKLNLITSSSLTLTSGNNAYFVNPIGNKNNSSFNHPDGKIVIYGIQKTGKD
jgi:hypothetical protein